MTTKARTGQQRGRTNAQEEQALIELLSGGLSDEEIQRVLACALLVLEKPGLDQLITRLGEETGRTLRSLLESRHASHRKSPQQSLPIAGSAKIHRIPVRTGSRIHFVPVQDIDWIEGAGNYVLLHASGQQHRIRSTLKGLAERLGPQRFVRIHQSCVVNLDRVKELQPWSHGEFVVVMRDGTELTSSRTYSGTLREMLEF